MTQTLCLEQASICAIERKPIENNLNTIILEAIDESLASFGENLRQTVYSQLQNNFNVAQEEIPLFIEEFTSTIEELFGDGALLIELKIMEKLHANAKGFLYIPRDEAMQFIEYLRNISYFLENSIIG